MNLLQTYKFKSSFTNEGKLKDLKDLGKTYRAYYNHMIRRFMPGFYRNEGTIPKFLPCLPFTHENFSERYKQTCGKQVKSNLVSWLSNVKNRVREKITGSNLSEHDKRILYTINKHGLWFKKEVNLKNGPVPQDLLKLSKKIFHRCRGCCPKLRNIVMALDAKVASVEKSRNSFDYWIKLATLRKGSPIYLPLKSYDYFENKKGILKKQIQVIIRKNLIEYGLVKDVEFKEKEFIEGKVIGLDTGVVIPLSTSTGNQYGLGLYGKLKRLDKQIMRLTVARMRNGFYRKSARLDRLYNKARSLLKNEIGRISNRFLENEKPEEIILENNKDITKSLKDFSPRMRRIIKNSGITKLRDVLISKATRDGLHSVKVNQAYTSQECPVCHHVDSGNRKNQKVFKCVKCKFTRNADYVGAVNIRNRRSVRTVDVYTPFRRVRELLGIHYGSCAVFQT